MGLPLIGVLALQGDFARHCAVLNEIGVPYREVRTPEDLAPVDALILPGGESTTLRLLMKRTGLWEALRERKDQGFPVFGTCAGLILLAEALEGARPDEETLGFLSITVRRNAYGRQRESFVARIPVRLDSDTAPVIEAVFIRAPVIVRCANEVRVLAEYQDKPVLVASRNGAGATFHPELVSAVHIHEWFLREFVKSAA
ncbi:MAG: pyridoxal 5'-phosphate synthase glutaminase subunit PdxT [bacterium JZ-2024 1]